jgi:hypothetical protein
MGNVMMSNVILIETSLPTYAKKSVRNIVLGRVQ